ncbi:MAG TPA: hypothetical protein VFI23_16025 [Rhizomicrobium sp.]|nr:hypothetical protein [Rhizomicrobium sp.]
MAVPDMVALDNTALFGQVRRLHLGAAAARLLLTPLVGILGGIAAALVLGAIVFRGFSENGFRLGSEWAWRYACLVFFAALVGGPACRIVAHFLPGWTTPQNLGRKLVWGFCASYAVYLLSVFLPNVIQLSAGASLMTLFGAGVVLVMAVCAAPLRAPGGRLIFPEKFRRALLGTAAIYFWLCYSVMALARISGPHRPDDFYGISLCLMVAGLLARYADRWISGGKAPQDRKTAAV